MQWAKMGVSTSVVDVFGRALRPIDVVDVWLFKALWLSVMVGGCSSAV